MRPRAPTSKHSVKNRLAANDPVADTWPIGLSDHVALLSQDLALNATYNDRVDRSVFDPQQIAAVSKQIGALPNPLGLLANLAVNAPLGLAVWDAEGRVLLANGSLVDMFGSEPPADYNVFKDEIAARLGIDAAMRRAFNGEVVILPTFWYDPRRRGESAQGRRIAIALSVLPIFDADGTVGCVATVYRDETQAVMAQQQLKAQSEQLEQHIINRTAELEEANEELEAFTYSVSHDLRAPLRTIDAFAELLANDGDSQLSSRGRDYLNRMRAATARMGDLINDLLAFARMGRQSLNIKAVQPAELVAQVLQELQPRLQGRNVEVEFGNMPQIQADPVLLREVFLNLLENAIKFTGSRERAVIRIGSNRLDRPLVWYVSDNGVGFDMEHYGRLFVVFSRLHSAEQFEGTGVGLALVQRIVKRHGGQIWAHAQPDLGASFYFTLSEGPLDRGQLEAAPAE
jgi:signal transduction histidine kinase